MDEEKTTKMIDKDQFQGKIQFKDVWFRYPSRKENWVLRGLNLTINPQETVALVGESGCGKSTFVNLLLRFYEVDSGEVLIDGVNIKEYNLHSLRAVMGYVMQEPILFHYSVLENILYGNPDASNSEVHEAARIANALEFIERKEIVDNTIETVATTKDKNLLEKVKATHLLSELEMNQMLAVEQLGQKKYDELIKKL